MSLIEALFLGLIQGLTEFIPVSSSGHLILAHEAFGTDDSTLAFDVALHVGTLMALLIFFKNEIFTLAKNVFLKNKEGAFARLILYATVPAVLAGLFFGEWIDEHLRSTLLVACTLALGGFLMLFADRYAKPSSGKTKNPSTRQGIVIGFAQALALIPGVSRSGATMTAGFFLGLDRVSATRFSFLLALPIITGSAIGILIRDGDGLNFNSTLIVGVGAAFFSGLFAIKFMLKIIGNVGLKPFAYYRILLAIIALIVLV